MTTTPNVMKTRFASSFACTLFCSLSACQVIGQDAIVKPRDFSTINSVTLLLVEAQRGNALRGQALEHIYWERDGRTTVMDVEGVACRSLNLTEQGRAKAYLYFAIHPSFKNHDVAKVRIEVEYFD